VTVNSGTYHSYGTGTYDIWLEPDSIEDLPDGLAGTYIVMVYLAKKRAIEVGKLADILFPKGYYTYVGSAMRGIKARLRRHFALEKNYHWHIDYLLEQANAIGAFIIPGVLKYECILARALDSRFVSFQGFGSSDCRCSSHLFFSTGERQLKDGIRAVVELPKRIQV
jgi:Uri superfamily endonuclease